ncbi:MAG: HNH endonuclease [Thermincolia bacterium]
MAKTVPVQCTNPECPKPNREFEILLKDFNRGRGKYCSLSCSCIHRMAIGNLKGKPPLTPKGEQNPNWRGGRIVQSKGYVMVKAPSVHPGATKAGYIMEHIMVAEEMLGRHLTVEEEVHHRNSNKKDNRRENLFVFPSGSLHSSYHHAVKKRPQLTPEGFMAEVMVTQEEVAAHLVEVAAVRAG